MKKIGIMTFHRANNYGAVLQAYALQKYLTSQDDTSVQIIDYISDAIEKRNRFFTTPIKGSKVKYIAQIILCAKDIWKIKKKFELFRRQYLSLSEPVNKNSIDKIRGKYNILISGSDQIWNPEITKFDDNYFLCFACDEKKYSYAASIGEIKHISENISFYTEKLKSYESISLREESAYKEIIKTIKGVEARVDVDPVFLVDRSEWELLVKPGHSKGYVLFFYMGSSKTALPAMEYALYLSKKYNLDPLLMSDTERWYKYRQFKHFGAGSPVDFITLIANANIVVTNSFHAASFSIIFNKQFYVETNVPRPERINNLLARFHLNSCALTNGKSQTDKVNINWERVNKDVEEMKNNSKHYLSGVIK